MSTDDKTMGQDGAASVASDPALGAVASATAPTAADSAFASASAGTPGDRPDIATPGTAVASPPAASAAPAPASSGTAVQTPPAKSISPSSQPPSIPAESTTLTTTAPTATSPTTVPVSDVPAAVTASHQPDVQSSTSSSDSSATVAAPAPAPTSEPQQNGDSKTSEADSEMASYRPAFTAHHGLPVSYSTTGGTMQSSLLSASSPPGTSAYASSTGISTTQYSSYPSSTIVSHSTEGYRVSPVPSSNPMSLPSMRTIDSLAQQRASQPQMPHHTMSMSMNAPLAPVSSGSPFYPPHHTMSVPSNYGLPSDSLQRYPLPHDPRILGSRGHKKVRLQILESYCLSVFRLSLLSIFCFDIWTNRNTLLQEIKRRTKTGCLTCRKRRIKVGNGPNVSILRSPFPNHTFLSIPNSTS